ncbi:MAG: hypothetical protein SFU85_09785 [Candidatus Methylacidiphilales bacterium]|nr:hypothetical protein [Candidatus Methylacidiphilales bacterium]
MSTKNVGTRFLDAFAQVGNLQTQTSQAKALGVTQPTISNWKKGGTPRESNFIRAFHYFLNLGIKQGRKKEVGKLIGAVSFVEGTSNQTKLAAAAGVKQATISNWKSGAAFPTKNNIAKLLRQRSRLKVRILTEMFSIKPVSAGATWRIHADPAKRKKLQDLLTGKHGIYVFYDSRGIATYVGMAQKLDFFTEIEQRLKQAKLRGKHYVDGLQPKTNVCQGQVVCRMSAYEVPDLQSIRPLEAFAIRAFMNGILNRRRESLK